MPTHSHDSRPREDESVVDPRGGETNAAMGRADSPPAAKDAGSRPHPEGAERRAAGCESGLPPQCAEPLFAEEGPPPPEPIPSASAPVRFWHRVWFERWFPVATAIGSIAAMFIILATTRDHGGGWPRETEYRSLPFRFDAYYYLSIMKDGYVYDGNPGGSPNIVFLPLFPLLGAAVHTVTRLPHLWAGFVVVWASLVAGQVILFKAVDRMLGRSYAIIAVVCVAFSTGSYANSSFYAEGPMLLALALCLYGYADRRPWIVAIGSLGLGLSKIPPAPLCAVLALWLGYESLRRLRAGKQGWGHWFFSALVAAAGPLLYLGYIWLAFGEHGHPFELLPKIQNNSWGRFRGPVSWDEMVSLHHLRQYTVDYLNNGMEPYRQFNLLWTWLATVASVWILFRPRLGVLRFGFVLVFLLVYHSTAGSPFLASTTRFYASFLPIAFMLGDLDALVRRVAGRWPALVFTGSVLALNFASFVFYANRFLSGHWFYF